MARILSLAVLAVVVFGVSANAAEPKLSKMGLGGLKVMSDVEGSKVRGMGSIAVVGGVSFVNLGVTGGANGGFAAAAHGGTTQSTAGQANITVGGVGFSNGAFVVAGTVGGSIASAK